MHPLRALAFASLVGLTAQAQVFPPVTPDAPVAGRPAAILNLATPAGLSAAGGQWYTHGARVVEVAHHVVGSDLAPSGPANATQDLDFKAGMPQFEDLAKWDKVSADSLDQRRANGRLCFQWYRTRLTLPEKVGSTLVRGTTVVFEVVVDDYSEVWVNGRQDLALGQAGGPAVKGFNAPNRVVLTRDAKPGDTFDVAVFGANGPLSNPPGNYIWIRSATLDFHPAGQASVIHPVETKIDRLDPELDRILPKDARIERVATGFLFTEGPIWDRKANHLLFSDPNANTIYRWTPDGQVSVFRTKSGYTGADIGDYGQPGSNGLTLDGQGRLTVDQHGERRVIRVEPRGNITVLADRFEGKRLNSPNDLVYRSDGALYFTDPPFGLPKFFDDPRKELPYSGVFCLIGGKLKLVSKELTGPNGIAFSPDERYLYVTNWDPAKKVIMRYEVRPDGDLVNGMVFFDMAGAPGEEALDGMKVDKEGHLFVSGPGGVWVIGPDGKHLGMIRGPELAANFAWGDEDGRALYMTARTSVYRIRLSIPGIRP